eukprot:CAMPEP_0195520430 /NCGR_PEP_ID=MMETSP0794_2-20130614/16855_1 /TAXON_ID=515487 /ORGANISM="Stephanopyxis turris, Strain CCMP 815" /LENGTH=263 /DNA_ID=CAMNT_0040649781 /DNA_START=123 /DNA_END=911 /DNA_ORIENTATION=+
MTASRKSSLSPSPSPTNHTTTSNNRVPNTTVVVPIIYGSIAFWLGREANEYSTHEWTLYVRGPNDEDLSCAISKVVFQLHPSFPQPVRELSCPPFEVTEKGWGEFEATIRILWRDPSEKALLITHGIKLYPPGLPQQITTPLHPTLTSKDKPVLHEFYDEVVFTNPTESFYQTLQPMFSSNKNNKSKKKTITPKENLRPHWKNQTYSDDADFNILMKSQEFLEEELKLVKDRIIQADDELLEIEAGQRALAAAKAKLGGSGSG